MNPGSNSITPDVAKAMTSSPDQAPPPQDSEVPQKQESLTKRAYVGALWTATTHIGENAMGFVSNVVITWLIAKEMLGIMALVSGIITGLQMFADVGITPSLIQNKRDDPAFYNTAWTISVIRGFVLWLVACAIAWPMSMVNPEWEPLLYLLPVAGLTALVSGMRSTAWVMASRRLKVKSLTFVQLFSSTVRISSMLALAYWVTPTAWALVIGWLVGQVMVTILSHFIIPDIKNRFHFEREAFSQLINYGKWVFLSTIVNYCALYAETFMLGYLSVGLLGLYYVATRLTEIGPMLASKIGSLVGFPALSELYRKAPERFYSRLLKLRIVTTLPINALLILMILFAPMFMYWVYRPAYCEAGWVVQVLCINRLAAMVSGNYRHVFLTTGHTKYQFMSTCGHLAAVLVSTGLGYYLAGEKGLLLGIAVSQWLKYLVDAALARRCGYLQSRFDLLTLSGCLVLAWLALMGSNWMAWTFVI